MMDSYLLMSTATSFPSPNCSIDIPTDITAQLRDPATVRQVYNAIDPLRTRGLVKSANWLTQLYIAMESSVKSSSSSPAEPLNSLDTAPQLPTPDRHPPYMLAKNYFDMRQYRCAEHALRELHTPQATFLRLYSRFLSGEKRKEEERQELGDISEPVNMELEPLRHELSQLRSKGDMDAHLYYLQAVVLKHLHITSEAIKAFEESLRRFPYNWGAWLELAPLANSCRKALALDVGDHWMRTLFLGHVLIDINQAEQARTLFEELLDVLPSSTYFKGQLALALYHLRLFDEAQQLYIEIFEELPYSLEGMDVYSNILYVKEDAVNLSLLANRCMKIDKFTPETCCVIGNYYSFRRDREQAVTFFQRALKLNRNYLSAWTLMGHEFLEMKNTAAAAEAYRRAIDINPNDFRPWYGLGQTYELLSMPLYTLYYYQKAVAMRPKDTRMWCAMGQVFEELSKMDDAIRCYERARDCDEEEDSIALAKLAYLYEKMASEASKDGRQQELAALYTERAAEYHLANLKRLEEEKPGGPEAVSALKFLAEYHYTRNGLRLAEQYCQRLMNYPGHDKEFGKKLLRQIQTKKEKVKR